MTAVKKMRTETHLNVLLVEDSMEDGVTIIKACMEETSHYDYNIIRRYTLEGGMDYLNRYPADIVLLDLALPDARGLKSVTTIHKAFPNLPIVVISGCADFDTVHNALESGAQEFLVKGESSGVVIRQSLYQAMARKKIEQAYQRGERL